MAYLTRDIVHSTTGDSTGFISGSTGGVLSYSGSVWAGVEGASAYTVGDIVTALKRIGVLAQ